MVATVGFKVCRKDVLEVWVNLGELMGFAVEVMAGCTSVRVVCDVLCVVRGLGVVFDVCCRLVSDVCDGEKGLRDDDPFGAGTGSSVTREFVGVWGLEEEPGALKVTATGANFASFEDVSRLLGVIFLAPVTLISLASSSPFSLLLDTSPMWSFRS